MQDQLVQLYQKAQLLFEQSEFEEALEYSRKLLAEDDEVHDFWTLEGKIRFALGEVQAAERAIDRACQVAPGLLEPLLHKASFLNAIDRYEDALSVARKAQEYTDGDEWELLYVQAEANVGLGRFLFTAFMEEWFAINQELLDELTPQDLPPRPDEVHEHFEAAFDLLEQVVDMEPNFPEAWHLRSVCLLEMGQPDAAIVSLKSALELEPDRPDFWHELGVMYEMEGQFDNARQAYRELFELEEDFAEDMGMEFSREEFNEVVQAAIEDTEAELLEMVDEPMPRLAASTEDFPTEDLLDLPENEGGIFNPWSPVFLRFEEDNAEGPTLHFVFYQRNIERDMASDSHEELYELVRSVVQDILTTPPMEEDTIEA